MSFFNTWKSTAVCLLILAMTLTACDSGDSDSTPTEDLSAMFVNVQSALSVALSGAFTGKAETPVVNCPEGGNVNVVNNGGTSSLNLSMDFNDCNGVDGSLNMNGTTTFNSTQFVYNLTMSGQLEERCTVSYNNFQQSVTSNLQTGEATSTLNGSINADCGGNSVTCSFNNITINPSSSNTAIFNDSCN